MTRRSVWLLLALVACRAGELEAVPPRARSEPCRVTIEFDPPLPVGAELVVRHESGFTVRLQVPPSGVDLRVPQGPATLVLHLAGTRRETVLRAADGTVLRWEWRTR
ncbi:MAG TPA: hypothetical protein ENI87_11650 [bacterium]|nr:hypothetical protein [bacterium]